jgi:hypothetical protein
MKLEDVFKQGHSVAVTRGPLRRVVHCPNTQGTTGMWPVADDALEAVVFRKKVEPGDLAGTLSDADKAADTWSADEDHCWCEECHATRKMLETHGD